MHRASNGRRPMGSPSGPRISRPIAPAVIDVSRCPFVPRHLVCRLARAASEDAPGILTGKSGGSQAAGSRKASGSRRHPIAETTALRIQARMGDYATSATTRSCSNRNPGRWPGAQSNRTASTPHETSSPRVGTEARASAVRFITMRRSSVAGQVAVTRRPSSGCTVRIPALNPESHGNG